MHHKNSFCLDCKEADSACDTCSFAVLRNKWKHLHGVEVPPKLWAAAYQWGGRHVYVQVRRQGFKWDSKVCRTPHSKGGKREFQL